MTSLKYLLLHQLQRNTKFNYENMHGNPSLFLHQWDAAYMCLRSKCSPDAFGDRISQSLTLTAQRHISHLEEGVNSHVQKPKLNVYCP